MDKSRIRQQLAQLRQTLFDEGVLNDYFINLETIDEAQPNFLENIIGTYLNQSALYLDELQETLDKIPLNLANVNRLIQKLRGSTASIGAGKFCGIIEDMCNVFRTENTDRLYAAFENVRAEYAILKLQLEPYAELLHLLREDVPADEESGTLDQEDVESVDSNDTNE